MRLFFQRRGATLALASALACLTTAACVHGGSQGDPLSADLSSVPAQLTSVADWDQINSQTRHDLVEGDYPRVKGLTMTKRQLLGDVSSPAAKQLAQAMAAFMRKNGDMQVDDDHHSRIGSPSTWVEFLTLANGTIVAGRISFEQLGCDQADDKPSRSFPTAAAAAAAKCTTATGSGWSASGSFNHDAVPFEYADFMSWNGPTEPML